MRAPFFLIPFLLAFYLLKGQTHVEGRVVDSLHRGLAFADVVLTDGAHHKIAHSYCDSLGHFNISINKSYPNSLLMATYLNDSSKIFTLSSDPKEIYVLTIFLDRKLNEVSVTAKNKPFIEKKVDRMVYNIEGRASFENKSVLEALKHIPGIAVDKTNISLLGKGSVGVLINDKIIYLSGKDLTDYLNLFRDDIASVEVIPNPPAKYDAEGGGGLINIVTKKNKLRGLFGDISLALTKNSYAEDENSINLKLRTNNINISAGLGYTTGAYRENIEQGYIFKDSSSTSWKDVAKNKLSLHNWLANFILEWMLSRKTSLNFSYSYTNNYSNSDQHHTINYFSLSQVDSTGVTGGFSRSKSQTQSFDINLHSSIGQRKGTLDLYFDFITRTGNELTNTLTKNYFIGADIPTGQEIGLYSYGSAPKNVFNNKLDLSFPKMLLGYNLEMGYKFTHYDNTSHIAYDQTINVSSIFQGINTANDFTYKETNPALYVSADKNFNKLQTKFGVRYEGTYTEGDSSSGKAALHRSFSNVFPSVFLLYNLNNNLSLDASYSRRISRPRIWDINPYRWYTSVYSFNQGNPELVPCLQDNFEFNIGIKSKIFINLFYNIKHGPIVSLPNNEGNLIENIKVNNGQLYNYGTNLNANFSFLPKMQNTFSVSLQSYHFITDYSYAISSPVSLTIAGNQSYEFSETSSAELDFSATLPGGAFEILSQTGSYNIGASFRKLFYKNKLILAVGAEDIFRGSSPTYKTNTSAFTSTYYNYYDFRAVTINIKYKFGKELKSARKKAGINNSERMRL